ncbi:MAG: adenylate/guanylate cyclase domain-containing protein [Marinibacterium sp.]
MIDRSHRRLAAILAADIVGYSRLVGDNEDATIQSLKTLRSDVLGPIISAHSGRVANTAGDSLLLEFSSAVAAVDCALAMQRALHEQPAANKMQMRVGLNVGDVISDGDDILGDGVNIAARLEALAEPGGILASGAIVDHALGKAEADFTKLGKRRLKNIATPVEVYAVAPGRASGSTAAAGKGRRYRRAAIAAGIVLAAMAAGLMAWRTATGPGLAPASMAQMAFPLPDKPSVAVLPFKTFSEQTVFLANGLTDDLITDLSKVSGLFVIAGNTSFALRDTDMDVARFSEAVGVRYVIDGGLRRTGDDLRVNARLVDAMTGQLVWADRYEGVVDDIFAIQTQLAIEVTTALGIPVADREMSQMEKIDTQLVEAREAFQQGWELYSNFNERDNIAAIAYFERAVALDPDYGRAYAALALAHLRPHLFPHWNNFVPAGEDLHITRFYQYFQRASEYEDSLVHVIRAMIRLNFSDIVLRTDDTSDSEAARTEAARAIALNPNDPEAHITMAWALIAGGQAAEGLAFADTAMRLDPEYPTYYVLFQVAGLYALGDLETAVAVLDAALARDPNAAGLVPVKASLLAQLGRREEARAFLDLWPSGGTPASLAAAVEEYYFIVRWTSGNEDLNQRLKDGLRLAALPGSVTVSSLRADLGGRDPVRRLNAARSLALFGPDAAVAVPELVAALDSGDAILVKAAIVALGRIGPSAAAAIPALEAIRDKGLIGRYATRALASIRAK